MGAEDGDYNLAVLVVYRLLARSWGPYNSERFSISSRILKHSIGRGYLPEPRGEVLLPKCESI